MSECERRGTCRFFKEYQETNGISCKEVMNEYCSEPEMGECKRKEHFQMNVVLPLDDMMLHGQMMVLQPAGTTD